MKKWNLLLVVLMISITTAFAQNFVTFGLRGGLNYTSVSGDFDLDYYDYWSHESSTVDQSKSSNINFNIGIDVLYPLNDKMALQAELVYSREGYKGEWSFNYEGITKGTFTDKYSFLNIPVFFRYNFTEHFYVMGGPQFSVLLSARHKGESVYEGYDPQTKTIDLADRMNKLSIGITPALGYDLNKMNFSLRYYAGLTPLAKSEHDIDIKSRVLSLVVSYKVFTLKK